MTFFDPSKNDQICHLLKKIVLATIKSLTFDPSGQETDPKMTFCWSKNDPRKMMFFQHLKIPSKTFKNLFNRLRG
jgi:hypothetical protein